MLLIIFTTIGLVFLRYGFWGGEVRVIHRFLALKISQVPLKLC